MASIGLRPRTRTRRWPKPSPRPPRAAALTEHVGASATALPFTAKLDPQGRINKVEVDLPQANTDGSNVVYGFSAFDHGKPVSVTKPAGRIVEMPAEAYK